MWCNYCDNFCLNPVCAFGCVERASDREDAKTVLDGLAKLINEKKERNSTL